MFIPADTSTVNKIGRVYGLVQGADISGTTSDSIYFMNLFGGAGLDPIFQVLPLATIVAGAHHSMLEVALSLVPCSATRVWLRSHSHGNRQPFAAGYLGTWPAVVVPSP